MPHDEDALLDALARLHVLGADAVGKDSRYVGPFRAHGLVVPVWDLRAGNRGRRAGGSGRSSFAGRLAEAMADRTPLDDAAAPGPGRAAQPATDLALTVSSRSVGIDSVRRPAGRTRVSYGPVTARVRRELLREMHLSDIVATRPERCCIPRRLRSGPFMSALTSPRYRRRNPSLVGTLGRMRQAASGSRLIGQDMQRGPPRPLPSSLPAMATTSMPASSRRALVSVLRS